MLDDLIPELLDEVISLLDLSDLCYLRLASRRLEQRSRRALRTAAFSAITTDFSRASLARLTTIAETGLGPYVRSLRVAHCGGEATKYKRDYEFPYGDDGYWPRLEGGSVDPDAELAAAFAAAIARFPNCASATVTDERARLYRPANMPRHPRDPGPTRCLSSSDALELVLRAYGAPCAPPLTCLHVRILRNVDWWPPDLVTGAAVAAVIRAHAPHLREIVLDHDADVEEHVLDLLSASRSLGTLRFSDRDLAGDRATAGYRVGRLLRGLPFAPPLEHLALGQIALQEADLLQLLSRCSRTLATLALFRVGLAPGSCTGVLRHLHYEPFPRLRRVSIQACRNGDGTILAFCPLWKTEELRPRGAFEFRWGRTARRAREMHFVGALFEAGCADEVKPGLRALMEGSHEASLEKDVTPPCADIQEIRNAGAMIRWTSSVSGGERWTGLSAEYMG